MINGSYSVKKNIQKDDSSISSKRYSSNSYSETPLRDLGNTPNIQTNNANPLNMDQFLSPVSGSENNSPMNVNTSRRESVLNEEEEEDFTMKELGNFKEYFYFVSLLNQNFSFKDFAILKITDENIKLAVVPRDNREKYSKYFFNPAENILSIDQTILNTIFKNRSLKFQFSPNDIEAKKGEDKDLEKVNHSNLMSAMKKQTSNDTTNENQSTENSTTSFNTETYDWDLNDLGNPSDLIILDIEKLFMNTYCAKGSMFKGNSNIFQLNTDSNVYIMQASSKSKKKEICNIIRIIGGMQNPIQKLLHHAWNPSSDIPNNDKEDEENIIKYLFNTYDKYEHTMTELQNELLQKTQQLKEILENFNNLSKSNINVLKDLKSAKEKNAMLQEKINEMKMENSASVNKIRSLNIRLESNKLLLNECYKTFTELEEKSKNQPNSFKKILIIVISVIVFIIAFLYKR